MLKTRIEQTREHLNDLIILGEENISSKDVMLVSQVLDDLLVEYLKELDKDEL
ncbi:MAG: Spo0E family sporulation regulatory protein-aspartic acid phosphatase [Epulopiscium sp.]|nr:Spo0E family sporulation regulatory protein-aspartic acid phosphatase [Candidatus Epulonipiscium sp.]HOQ15727.1 aspartyl-phosphate phosphatase Spo0E family protein [Defluviitaleaceae bacterium]